MQQITDFIQLSQMQLVIILAVVFIAGIVRGFSGFALSALVMAALASFLPPVEILPMNFILEATAGLIMVRGGIKHADMRVVIGLVVFSALGMPSGLYLTTHLPVETTRLMALSTILLLTILLLANFRPKNPDSPMMIYGAGFLAGLATGIAGVGGMVVVIFVFSLGREARVIRASLVMYLFFSLATSLIFFVYFGLMTETVMVRGAIFSVPTIIGVLVGSQLFSKSHDRLYRIFCLGLLILLSVAGLLRVII